MTGWHVNHQSGAEHDAKTHGHIVGLNSILCCVYVYRRYGSGHSHGRQNTRWRTELDLVWISFGFNMLLVKKWLSTFRSIWINWVAASSRISIIRHEELNMVNSSTSAISLLCLTVSHTCQCVYVCVLSDAKNLVCKQCQTVNVTGSMSALC